MKNKYDMQTMKIEPFKVIGIKVRTTNENGQAAHDIGALWEKFMSERILDKIPVKIDLSIYAIYTNYQDDYTKPYDIILGNKVDSLERIPEGMVGQIFEGGTYTRFVAKGDLHGGSVYRTWTEIWSGDLERKYTADFEVYGEKAQNTAEAEVDIFIAIKE